MAGNYQDNRSVKITTPLGADKLLLTRMAGSEQLSRPFRFELDLLSEDGDLDPDRILGKSATVRFTYGASGQARFFNGVVTEFGYCGYNQTLHEYRAVLRPRFWLLSRRSDCRVVQNKSVSDIFSSVSQEAGSSDVKVSLSGSQPVWEYRVQYGESDFDFLSRLLEHEGIFYYFEHYEDRHVMVLANDVGKLSDVSGYQSIPYYAPTTNAAQRARDHLSSWSQQKSFEAGAFASRDFNFEAPSTVAAGSSSVERRTDARTFELYEYPAGANPLTSTGVESVTKLRAQQLQSSQTRARGAGDAAGLTAGRLFKLEDYPLAALNKQYLITAASFELTSDSHQSGGPGAGGAQFSVSIDAIDARESYRPPQVTPKPRIQGTQTAMVVGTSGAEITTDKYGRIKVQFHWDRAGKSDENSSCWVRVAQPWASRNWGAIQLPRVGDEVVVSFLDGDPDHPLIIGSVYNAEHMPPYTLPDNQTQSGIKTRSSPNGSTDNFNELRFEDKKGAEEVYLHAERNLTVVVENNQTITVGMDTKDHGDRTTQIYNDDSLTVGHDQKVEVKNDSSITVDHDRTLTVKNDLTSSVTGQETRTVSKDRSSEIKQNDQLKVGSQYTLKAGDQITLQVGSAKIVMTSDGTVEISGSQLKFKGSSSAELDATQTTVSGTQLDLKGTKTTVAGSATLDLNASGIASLKGSLTKIG